MIINCWSAGQIQPAELSNPAATRFQNKYQIFKCDFYFILSECPAPKDVCPEEILSLRQIQWVTPALNFVSEFVQRQVKARGEAFSEQVD